MTTFDDILPALVTILHVYEDEVQYIKPIYINRDLNGRVRLIVSSKWEHDARAQNFLGQMTQNMHEQLGLHAVTANSAVLYEQALDEVVRDCSPAELSGDGGSPIEGVFVIDRLATAANWASIAPVASGVPRVVFYSIKGGVGRSTAMAATAWSLAQSGKRVLVLDLDLESPGLSSSLLQDHRRPKYGITDWLVEDLVNNGDAVFQEMIATSTLSRDGDIYVVPAHGKNPGEYVNKLGRAWMPKVGVHGVCEAWSLRLQRLLESLESKLQPDIILIDSRAGIDEVASACVTNLGAVLVLLFALDGEQTWSGYRMLFQHWRATSVVRAIRERLLLVGALIPEIGSAEYYQDLRQSAWNVFSEELYDEVAPGEPAGPGVWSFDESEDGAPHVPPAIRWHRGFAALRSMHSKLEAIDGSEVSNIFGELIEAITMATTKELPDD